MKLSTVDAPKRYWGVESAIGTLDLLGRINSREIAQMVDVDAVAVTNYTKAMNCVRRVGEEKVQGRGRHAVVFERTHFPGDICDKCPANENKNCIIGLIAQNPDNLQWLPYELAQKQKY